MAKKYVLKSDGTFALEEPCLIFNLERKEFVSVYDQEDKEINKVFSDPKEATAWLKEDVKRPKSEREYTSYYDRWQLYYVISEEDKDWVYNRSSEWLKE